MALSLYAPLPADTFSIRLIKLQPSNDPSTPIVCKLVTYPVDDERSGSHFYECLSYVWGTETYTKDIEIHVEESIVQFEATPNLYEALLHLRDAFFEQILWIDAVCINQSDEDEKNKQVAAMARIYGLAKRVVVWLGAEADGSECAFQGLRRLAQTRSATGQSQSRSTAQRHNNEASEGDGETECMEPDTERAIQKLLNRPYFRRMWVR